MSALESDAGVFDRISPELVDAARRQPYVSFADPMAARRNFSRAVRLSRALRGTRPGENGTAVEETAFAARGGGRRIPVRIYRPAGAEPPLPVFLYFHGGAFVAGDLDSEEERCLAVADRAGCAVVSVDYRRAPEAPYPAACEDCYEALVWAAGDAGRLGLDAGRIAVGGASAGGTLAAAVALMAHDRAGPAPVLQMLLYPALDDRLDTPSFRRFPRTAAWTAEDSRHMWRCYLGGEEARSDPYAVPARRSDLTGVAPAYVLAAEVDALRDEAVDYAVRLQSAGVPTELHVVAGAFHGFDLAAPSAQATRSALAEQGAVLRAAFR